MSKAPKRTRKAVNLALATALITAATPAAVLGQQSPAVATTAIPAIPPAIRAMTAAEKTEYDGWQAAFAKAFEAKDHPEAERIARLALEREEATFGPAHPEVAGTLTYLSLVVLQQKRASEAEILARRATEIAKASLVTNDKMVIEAQVILSTTLEVQAKLIDAELILRQAFARAVKTYGPWHADTRKIADSIDRVVIKLQPVLRALTPAEKAEYDAWLTAGQSASKAHNWTEAEKIWRKALAHAETTFGPGHPETALLLFGIGEIYREERKYVEAEHSYRQALAIFEKMFSPEHPVMALVLNSLAVNFEAQSRPGDAEPLKRQALAIREKVFGPEHPDTASSLNSLAVNLGNQDRNEDAEQLYRRALAIREKALGPEHPDTASSLNNLASNLHAQGHPLDAEPLYRSALAIRQKALGPEHPDTASSLNSLATNLNAQGRHAEAEQLYRRALAIREKVLGPEQPDTTASLNNLGMNLYAQRRSGEAEPILRRALVIREKVLGPEHLDTATSLNDLASNLEAQGRAKDAEPMHRRALLIKEKILGAEARGTSVSLDRLAGNLDAQGRFAEAEVLFRRGLLIDERVLGPSHPSTAVSLNNLALNLDSQGRYSEAEPLSRRALAIREEMLGLEHPDTAQSLANLSSILGARSAFSEAEPLSRRALAIREKVLGLEHPDTALSMNSLAFLLDSLGRHNDAEMLHRRALSIREKVLGPEHPDTAVSLSNLAVSLSLQGRESDAEQLYRRALAIHEKVLGPEHPSTASNLNNLAQNLRAQARDDEAEPLYRRALAITEKSLGLMHPSTALFGETLSRSQLSRSPFSSLVSSRQALAVRRAIALREGSGANDGAQARLVAETGRASLLFVRSALSVSKASGGNAALTAESFDAAQSIGITGAGRALARGTALASLDAPGQDLARAWESALAARANLDKRFTAAAGVPGPDGDAQRARLGQERVQLDGEVKVAEEALRAAYPAYFNLIAPGPVSLAELQESVVGQQALLGADEALILVTPGDTRLPKGQQRGVVFAVTREGVAWGEIGIDPEALARDITGLRQLLDNGGSTRAPGSGRPPTGAQRGYDRATARRLYNALFGAPEIAKLIAGKKEWIISPQGALLSLPFAALVAGDYSGDDADVAALRSTPWLGMTKALAVIPEVSSLRALRGLSRPARSTQTPFFGIGDPDFARGVAGAPKTTVAAAAPAGAKRGAAAFPGQVRSYFRDAGADIGAVSSLARLPGTRIEIETLAKSLGAIPGSILLGDDATEKNLRMRSSDGSLARARVVAFATHGLIAGDLGKSLAQPALAFTPPAPAEGAVTETNDGLLTAGEAATLKLAADWVILSACNTAAGGGDNSADGLTGLARAFFYAGADSLIVSHWRVRDDAAARLTTRAVEIAAAPGSQRISRAAALQQSMRELMNDTSQDKSGASFAHPAAWAPFALIGAER